MKINLNADLGESFGPWKMGDDAALLQVVASASIACGFHAGDPMVMWATLKAARAAGVSVGAHPSYPDLQGFGRRAMAMTAAEVEAMLLYQLGALAGLAQAEGSRLTHVKPHGALNNQACEDAPLADAIARATRAFDRELILLAPVCSELYRAAERAGLDVAGEVFADRAYDERGALLPRRMAGAVLHDANEIVAHVLRMLDAGGVLSVGGKRIAARIDSICVHGDSPGAVPAARAVRAALQAAGGEICTLPALRS